MAATHKLWSCLVNPMGLSHFKTAFDRRPYPLRSGLIFPVWGKRIPLYCRRIHEAPSIKLFAWLSCHCVPFHILWIRIYHYIHVLYFVSNYMVVSTNGGTMVPQYGWFIREHPTKIRMIWGYPYGNQHIPSIIRYAFQREVATCRLWGWLRCKRSPVTTRRGRWDGRGIAVLLVESFCVQMLHIYVVYFSYRI